MALLDIGNAWTADEASDLFKKFLGSCLKLAAYILAEDAGTANHAARLSWAKGILSQDVESVYARVRQMIRFAAASNADFQADPSNANDTLIDYCVGIGLSQLLE